MTRHATINEEIAALRRIARRTRRGISRGTIDPLKGGRLVARITILLSSLVRLQDTIDLNTPRQADEIRLTNPVIKAARLMSSPRNKP